MNMVPVVTFLMALPFRLEKVNIKRKSGKAKLLGTLVCVGGAILLTLYRGIPLFNFSHSKAAAHTTDHFMKVSSSKRTERWIVGSLSLIAGMLLWSSWFVLQSNIGKLFPCQYSSTAIMSFFGAIQSAIFCLSKERNISIWVLKGKLEIVSVLYAGMVGSGLCYVGMSWCVKKRGPLFTAAFSPLIQILAAMFDIPILHEQLYLGSIFGSITVIIGLYMLLWGKNKEGDGSVNAEILVHETEEVKCQGPEFQTIEVGRDSQHPRT